jgi:ABC-2 type transport system ATP-binding protein
MTAETLIEARGLTRRFGPNLAVDNLDLRLAQGEILGLLGPNGAGKSTTMKMLTGNLAPTSGEVRIKGRSLAESPTAAKQSLGYLPEQPPVYPELNVDEYLAFCASLHGVPSKDRAGAIASAKRDCGLTDVGRRLIGNLSTGYQQRVGLAQAIIHRPPVVVLDEPTVGLDPNQIREIRSLIRDLGKNHSVILSSHILPEIQVVCGRVAIIHRGKLVYDAPEDSNLGAGGIVVGLMRPPSESGLQGIAGVASVSALGDGRFRVIPADGADPREALAAAAAKNDWGLIELARETRTLEDLFTRLTTGDHAGAALPEAA